MSFRSGPIAAFLLLLLPLSCHKTDTGRQGQAVPIALQAGMTDTKGAESTDIATLRAGGLGLFAWRTDTGTYFDGEEPYLMNEPFTYDGASSTWKGNDVWWPLGSWLSFFAYAPYRADVESGPLVFPSPDYSGGYPSADYTPAANPTEQEDLVLAAPVLDCASSSGTVHLNFSHALTKVVFRARWKADDNAVERMTANGWSVRITALELENIRGTGTVRFGRSGYGWDTPPATDLDTYATDGYTLSTTDGTLLALNQSASVIRRDSWNEEFVKVPEGVLYLIPQALASTALLRVTWGFYKNGSALVQGEEYEEKFHIGLLNQYVWPAEHILTYSVTLDLTPGGHPTIEATAGRYEDGTLPGSTSGEYHDNDNKGSGLSSAGGYVEGGELEEES